MSKKVNWAEVDIRIRDRRTDWTKSELEALDKDLGKIKDVADNAEPIDIPQPALANAEDEQEAADGQETSD